MIAYSFYESDSRIIQYARSLRERGDEVDVIALAHEGAARFEVVDGVNVSRIQKRTINEQKPISYLFRILRFLVGAMATVTRRHLRKHYDLLHVHSVPDFLIVAALPLRLMGVPAILDIHDILPEFYASKFKSSADSLTFKTLLAVERWSAKLASHVIVANKIWYERLVTRSVPAAKCSVICNYPNPAIFYPRVQSPSNGRFLLMYPGSLNWHQGVDVAIRAFARVSEKIRGGEFHIYGEGPTRAALERLIEELHLEDKVVLQDYRPVGEIAAIMATADVAVVPKRASSGFGNEAASTKIQEFMAVGVPVIVSRTKIDSLYFNDSIVRFVESENVDALAEAIVDLYSNPKRRRTLADGAYQYIATNNWDVKKQEYLDVVANLVKRGGASARVKDSGGVGTGVQSQSVVSLLEEFYRCARLDVEFITEMEQLSPPGYFRASDDLVCYGRVSEIQTAMTADRNAPLIAPRHAEGGRVIGLPFDPRDVISNLRLERYEAADEEQMKEGLVRRIYYLLRPFMPVTVRKYLQRLYLRGWEQIPFPSWPVDRTVDRLHEWLLRLAMKAEGTKEVPFVWFWPDGYDSCASVTHDVESKTGLNFCEELMDINDSYGIKTSFQVVPEERYELSPGFLTSMRARGFEINVHDLNHDGRLFFVEPEELVARINTINRYGKEFRARGFRSAVLYRKLEAMGALEFAYDMSAPNVGHLDPQRGGCCTTMPYFVGDLLEIPVTTSQDYTIFHILGDYSTKLWEEQLAIITRSHGMATFIVHPDYVSEPRAQKVYEQLLARLSDMRSRQKLWVALPSEINDWWRARSQMQLLREGDGWRVEGKGSERARVAYARIEGDEIVYRVSQQSSSLVSQ